MKGERGACVVRRVWGEPCGHLMSHHVTRQTDRRVASLGRVKG